MENKDLKISQLELATEVDGREVVPFAKDNGNGAVLVSLLMEAFREGMATQAALNGKQNQLTPGYGIEITAENEIRTNLDLSPFVLVSELPTSDIKNKIYCVPDPDGEVGKNERIEYMWLEDHWEVVGKFNPKVDLGDYLKSTDIERIYAKKTDIPDITPLATKTALNTLAEQVAQLKLAVNSLKSVVDGIPAMPLHDGRTYGVLDGDWEPIADVGENVATVTADEVDTATGEADTNASEDDNTE